MPMRVALWNYRNLLGKFSTRLAKVCSPEAFCTPLLCFLGTSPIHYVQTAILSLPQLYLRSTTALFGSLLVVSLILVHCISFLSNDFGYNFLVNFPDLGTITNSF